MYTSSRDQIIQPKLIYGLNIIYFATKNSHTNKVWSKEAKNNEEKRKEKLRKLLKPRKKSQKINKNQKTKVEEGRTHRGEQTNQSKI